MNKPKAFIDMDSTLCNTISAIASFYNHTYQFHKDFKPAIATECAKSYYE